MINRATVFRRYKALLAAARKAREAGLIGEGIYTLAVAEAEKVHERWREERRAELRKYARKPEAAPVSDGTCPTCRVNKAKPGQKFCSKDCAPYGNYGNWKTPA